MYIYSIFIYIYPLLYHHQSHKKAGMSIYYLKFLFYDVELKVDSIGQLVWGLASDMAGRGGFACTPETNVAPENGGFPIGISVSRGLFSGATVGGKNYQTLTYIHNPHHPEFQCYWCPLSIAANGRNRLNPLTTDLETKKQ